MNRVLSIDIVRGSALILMVLIHFMVYFGDSTAMNTWPYFFLNHVLGDWGAACFLLMTGMSQVLSSQKQSVDSGLLFRRALIRGAFIFLVGLIMLVLAWGPGHMWEWDILTLMGAVTVLLFLCRFLSPSMILLLALIVAVATPCLRLGIDYAALWGGKPVRCPSYRSICRVSSLIPPANLRAFGQ